MIAKEIRKDRVLGNFKKRGLEKATQQKKKSARDERDGMSDKHLALVRQLPCVHCLKMPCGEAHHLKQHTQERGMGLRSTDKWAVGLCPEHHREVESIGSKNETAWFRAIGVDQIALAEALWGATGDLPKMVRVLTAHRL